VTFAEEAVEGGRQRADGKGQKDSGVEPDTAVILPTPMSS
jgi:hypothetical protein